MEIKNAIEESGGYIERQLNSSLLQIRPEFFIDLIIASETDSKEKAKITKDLEEELRKRGIENTKIVNAINRKSTGKLLKSMGIPVIADIISVCVPGVGPVISNIINDAISASTLNFSSPTDGFCFNDPVLRRCLPMQKHLYSFQTSWKNHGRGKTHSSPYRRTIYD